jgi:hypothetical protein
MQLVAQRIAMAIFSKLGLFAVLIISLNFTPPAIEQTFYSLRAVNHYQAARIPKPWKCVRNQAH